MVLLCPRCRDVSLEEIEVGDVPLDRCPRCAGLWLDHGEIVEIAGPGKSLKALESMVPPSDHEIRSMACPRCPDVLLRRVEVGDEKGSPKIVFRCVSCAGTWLDRGELKRIEDPNLGQTLTAYFST
jgi:Zn-finger nucleic acid-binding protein